MVTVRASFSNQDQPANMIKDKTKESKETEGHIAVKMSRVRSAQKDLPHTACLIRSPHSVLLPLSMCKLTLFS